MMEFFEIGLYQRAFIAAVIIGFVNGYTSAFVLLHRSPLKLAAFSHSLLPGVAIAAYFFSLTVVTAFLGALVAAVIIGVLTVLLSRLSKINDETVLAVLYTGAFAIGIIVLNQLGSNQELEDWLLGNIIALSDLDLKMSFGVGIVAVTVLTLFRRALVANLFDPEVAASLGIRTRLLDYVSFVILILVLITTLQAVGCVLAVGLIVAPAAIARSFVSTPNALFPLSALVGAAGAAIGLLASYHFDQPAGSSITVVLATAFLLSVLVKSLRKI
jgi:manganese/iron transport system permease protein/iron/zinc/copper transport system permease protein